MGAPPTRRVASGAGRLRATWRGHLCPRSLSPSDTRGSTALGRPIRPIAQTNARSGASAWTISLCQLGSFAHRIRFIQACEGEPTPRARMSAGSSMQRGAGRAAPLLRLLRRRVSAAPAPPLLHTAPCCVMRRRGACSAGSRVLAAGGSSWPWPRQLVDRGQQGASLRRLAVVPRAIASEPATPAEAVPLVELPTSDESPALLKIRHTVRLYAQLGPFRPSVSKKCFVEQANNY